MEEKKAEIIVLIVSSRASAGSSGMCCDRGIMVGRNEGADVVVGSLVLSVIQAASSSLFLARSFSARSRSLFLAPLPLSSENLSVISFCERSE